MRPEKKKKQETQQTWIGAKRVACCQIIVGWELASPGKAVPGYANTGWIAD